MNNLLPHDELLKVLNKASRSSDWTIVKYILDNFHLEKVHSLLEIAVINNNLEMVKFLIKKGYDINDEIVTAASMNNMEIFDYLIESGADVNQYKNKILFRSVNSGRFPFVEKMLNNYDFDEDTLLEALDIAIMNKNLDMVQLIIKENYEKFKPYVIIKAYNHDYKELLDFYLNNG